MTVSRARIGTTAFLAGVWACMVQVIFTRECLVEFLGNELTIGTVLAGWLAGISLGAGIARLFLRRAHSASVLCGIAGGCLAFGAILFQFQVALLRSARLLWGVLPGMYAQFHVVACASFLFFLPSALMVGILFPVLCELLGGRDDDAGEVKAERGAVSLVYAMESLGSAAAGVILTYLLLPFLEPVSMILLAMGTAFAGAACLIHNRKISSIAGIMAVICCAMATGPSDWRRTMEDGLLALRWRGFGVLVHETGDGRPAVRLVKSKDTPYQNLALTESSGEFALYGNGQFWFNFPDPISDEHRIHFIMAQSPMAKRVLVLGGNPVGDLTELLRYPAREIVFVNLDPDVGKIISSAVPSIYADVTSDPRVRIVYQDGPRFVKKCGEVFDVILVNAPEPSTASANRHYTVEFYRSLERILRPETGFLFTSLSSEERLQSEAVDLGATVYQTLRAVFPVVLVSYGSRNMFFAGRADAGLTFDRETLAGRSRKVKTGAKYFRPEYILGMDEVDPGKTAFVINRFASVSASVNTSLRPTAYYYNLLLWSRYSGSGLESTLHKIRDTGWQWVGGLLAVVALALVAGGQIVRRSRSNATNAGWTRLMMVWIIGVSGFCGMSLEILLLFAYQAEFGFIYSRLGLIVAAFMLGLAGGAWAGGRIAAMDAAHIRKGLAIAILLLMVLPAVSAWRIYNAAACSAGGTGSEMLLFLLVAIAGVAVGAVFPTANRLHVLAGGGVGPTAAITDLADHLGAAFGALLTGVVLVPLAGLGAACLLLVFVQALALCSLAFCVTGGREHGALAPVRSTGSEQV